MLLGVALTLVVSAAALAQATGTLSGIVTTQTGAVRLPGAAITVVAAGGSQVVGTAASNDQGVFRIDGLAPGRYDVRIALRGFDPVERGGVEVAADSVREVRIDLTLETIAESVSVAADDSSPATAATISRQLAADLVNIAPVTGDSFQALLPILPNVLRGDDGRLRLNGGRPDQSGLQLAGASVTDAVTGEFGIELPIDAVEALEVVASPYLTEFGRFSTGVTRIETRRAANAWAFTANNFVPMPRFRGMNVQGLRTFSPRFLTGGAIVKDKLFLTQAAQYELRRIRVPSLPRGEDDRESRGFTTFTRLDAQPWEQHHLVMSLATFPRTRRFANLGTFVREPATADLREKGHQTDVAATSLALGGLVESRLTFRRYDVDVLAKAPAAMVVTPLGVTGRHFNDQRRDSRSLQWIESISRGWTDRTGEHLVKAGVDLLRSSYTGTSESRDVEVRDVNGALRELVRFAAPTRQDETASDLAVYLQDRWRPSDRLLVEYGGRIDRDGVLERFNFSPRVGASLSLWSSGAGVVRGGVGRFVQRTPLMAAAFESFERRTVTRYGADGSVAQSIAYLPVREAEATPSARIASIEYDHRLARGWTARIGHLRRDGSREFLVEERPDRGVLALTGNGRSQYRETELTIGHLDGLGRSLSVSYVHTSSRADYNHLDRYFGNLRQPLVRANAFARTDVDVPHRLIARGIIPVFGAWQVNPIVEIRTGFPYSLVDAAQDFVGVQNDGGRFPVLATLDLAVNRVIAVKGRRVRIGVRTNQLLNRFTPRDVQNNVDSGALGAFYNSIDRRIGLTFQILP